MTPPTDLTAAAERVRKYVSLDTHGPSETYRWAEFKADVRKVVDAISPPKEVRARERAQGAVRDVPVLEGCRPG